MHIPAAHLRSIIDQDGAVILDIRHDELLTLNTTGSYIWGQLKQGKLVEEIIESLACETGTNPAIVERDVRAFLEQLKSKHLLGVEAPR
jgi:hypothetical protein